jgi:hypothetical protein
MSGHDPDDEARAMPDAPSILHRRAWIGGMAGAGVPGIFAAYRFHEEDPIFCRDRLRLTCRCGERLDDITFHEPRETTFTT